MEMITRFFHESEKQYSPQFVASIVKKYGTDILIGGDPGFGADFDRAMKSVDKQGAKKHVYLFGPGMESWSSEEATEIRNAAESIGLDVDSKNWRKEWYAGGGWIKKVEEWFAIYGAMGFYSAEVDNIDSALENDPDKLMVFYHHMQDFCQKNKIETKLMIKNLSTKELLILRENHTITPFLAPFGIFEEGTGNPKVQTRLCHEFGITAVTPENGLRDTNTYGTITTGIHCENVAIS